MATRQKHMKISLRGIVHYDVHMFRCLVKELHSNLAMVVIGMLINKLRRYENIL